MRIVNNVKPQQPHRSDPQPSRGRRDSARTLDWTDDPNAHIPNHANRWLATHPVRGDSRPCRRCRPRCRPELHRRDMPTRDSMSDIERTSGQLLLARRQGRWIVLHANHRPSRPGQVAKRSPLDPNHSDSHWTWSYGIAPLPCENGPMFEIDLETAKNLSIGLIGGSIFFLLLVLKFAKSVVTKLLLVAIAIGVGYLSFTQRDDLNACAEKVRTVISTQGDVTSLSCRFFGQDISLSSIDLP